MLETALTSGMMGEAYLLSTWQVTEDGIPKMSTGLKTRKKERKTESDEGQLKA